MHYITAKTGNPRLPSTGLTDSWGRALKLSLVGLGHFGFTGMLKQKANGISRGTLNRIRLHSLNPLNLHALFTKRVTAKMGAHHQLLRLHAMPS